MLEEIFSRLKSPNLLENLVNDLGEVGIVGEPGNVVVVILTYNSRLCEHPLNLSPSGESGIGKSYLVCLPSDFWRNDSFVTGYMSRTSLIHDSDWARTTDEGCIVDLAGKVLVILEAESSKEFLDLMKPIRSHDKKEVSFKVTEREGKLRAKKVIMRGWPVFITLSVNPSSNQEDLTRNLNLTPEYTEDKGRAVNFYKSRKKEEPWKYPTDHRLQLLSADWNQAFSSLKPRKVVNPFATKLAENFDTRNPRSMRDFEKVLSLFDSCTLLHQYQRMILTAKNGEEYVVGTLDDLAITLKIANILLEPTTTGLRPDVLHVYREFFKRVCPPCNGRTVKEIMEEWSKRQGTIIKRSTLLESFLYPLRDAGLMNQDDSERTHRWEVSSVDLSEPVETNPTVLLSGYDLETGLRAQLMDLFESVGVSVVTRGESPISIASTENAVQEILGSVQASTIRQFFVNKLGSPMASCLRNEEKVSVGPPPTHSDSSDTLTTHATRGGSAERVTKACQMFKEGRDKGEIELTVGPEILEHCYQRGFIPRVGGRASEGQNDSGRRRS